MGNVSRCGESTVSRATEQIVFLLRAQPGVRASKHGADCPPEARRVRSRIQSSRVLHFNAFTEYGGTRGAVTATTVVMPEPPNILTCREGGENLVQLLRPT